MNEMEMCPYCNEKRGTHHKGYCSEYCRDMADIINRLKEAVKEIENFITPEQDRINTALEWAINVLKKFIPELEDK